LGEHFVTKASVAFWAILKNGTGFRDFAILSTRASYSWRLPFKDKNKNLKKKSFK
jgi:hypothetical protein